MNLKGWLVGITNADGSQEFEIFDGLSAAKEYYTYVCESKKEKAFSGIFFCTITSQEDD